jgi:hypothetical protein
MAPPVQALRQRPSRALVGHLLLVLPALLLLWAESTPGVMFFAWVGAIGALLVPSVVWFVWLVRRVRRRRWSWWLPVAPAGGCLVLALVLAGAPLDARWAVSRGAFAAQVKSFPAAPVGAQDWVPMDVPGRLGLYHVTAAYRVPGGVVFYESNGALFDDAGFAYLPGGPSETLADGSFESPQFRHLDGPWYAWTASW